MQAMTSGIPPVETVTITSDHPLRRASWIWPEGYLYLHNHYAQFHRVVQLEAVPQSAPLFITADKSYKLWINGVYVCRGPARGYQGHWPFDEIDVAGLLRVGANAIAIEAYNPGISTFSYLHATKAGLLCGARWRCGDRIIDIATGTPEWRCRRSYGRSTQTARLSLQMDFQEDADAACDDRAWITAVALPDDWSQAPAGAIAWGMGSVPFGQPPHDTVESRGIPLLSERLLPARRIASVATGQRAMGDAGCANISWHFIAQELPGATPWAVDHGVALQIDGDAGVFTVGASGADGWTALFIDIGEIVVGNAQIRIDGAVGGEIVDIHHLQCVLGDVPKFLTPGDGCQIALANRLRLVAGTVQHEFFHLMGFRQLVLVVRGATRPLTVRLSVRTAGYPFTMAGGCRSSDPVLNRIVEACRATLRLCALDAYVDTPWREQAQWWGDARVHARNTFFADGDVRLLVRGIRSLAGQRAPQGLTYGHAPTSAWGCILPDFALTWILTIADVQWQTGSLELFHQHLPRIREILAYFEALEVRDERGLLIHDQRFWLFEDWSTLPKDRTPTFLNLFHIYALQTYARLLEAAGMTTELVDIRSRIAHRSELVERHLVDARTGLFVACLAPDGTPVGEPSVHDQVLALLTGLRPQAHQAMIDLRILPWLRGESASWAVPSAFWATYVFEVMAQRGYGAEVVACIRRRWAPMTSTGTTWEQFDWDEGSGWSCTHAWSAHPMSHLVTVLAGLRQTAPAWREVNCEPLLCEGIDHVDGVVPTPHGMLRCAWQRHCQGGVDLQIEIPAGIAMLLRWQGHEHRLIGPLHRVFSA
jgi:alpha-L-rhamnosidase